MKTETRFKVRARFAYYDNIGKSVGLPPTATYLVMESDHPKLAQFSSVCGETLMQNGVGLPMTPTFKTWLEMGSPIFRGDSRVG